MPHRFGNTLLITLFLLLRAASAAEFSDDFTDDAFTQAHWTFLSPWECLSPAFTASGTAISGKLCLSSPTPTPGWLPGTVAIGYVDQPFDTYDVSVFASVSFTAAELSAPAIVKAIMLRYDPRQVPTLSVAGCPTNPDGGDLYYVDMDPHSSGANRFSIVKFVSGVQTFVQSGPPYVWPADLQHNVYFGVSWDPMQATNHLRAILYLDDIHNPLIDLTVDDASITPGNLWPGNTGNHYVGFLVSDDHNGPVNDLCLGASSQSYCPTGFGRFVVRDAVLDGIDSDGDGVGDACDSCPDTVPDSPVDADGCPPPAIPGDLNRDGDVDADDRAELASCRSGPGVPIVNPACRKADLDGDDDADQDDFGILQRCYRGTNVVGDPNCAN